MGLPLSAGFHVTGFPIIPENFISAKEFLQSDGYLCDKEWVISEEWSVGLPCCMMAISLSATSSPPCVSGISTALADED